MYCTYKLTAFQILSPNFMGKLYSAVVGGWCFLACCHQSAYSLDSNNLQNLEPRTKHDN